MSSLLVSRTVVVGAPAAEIFNLLADPNRHQEIDGSGTVKGAQPDAPKRLSAGARFGMSMKLGAPYKMTNTVTEFEENQLIAWRHLGHHTWRYQLEPFGDGSQTSVTETFDGTTSRAPIGLLLTGAHRRNAKAIERTLARLQQLFAVKSSTAATS